MHHLCLFLSQLIEGGAQECAVGPKICGGGYGGDGERKHVAAHKLVNIYKKKKEKKIPRAYMTPDALFAPIFVTADGGRGSRMHRGAKNMWWWVYMVVMVKGNMSQLKTLMESKKIIS